ncbi:MAG: hypothetical protein IPG80_18405 [Anaerolineales bacterium]|uniref:hypothetical protein n=1 Tax=Candidatus Villigracilis vicinus TaxID=3140679 RepID=UPI003136B3D9|nr:hypothetical protein [Anaerolineales bacterium]
MIQRILRGLEITILLFILAAMTGYSNPSLTNPIEKVRAYTRSLEFDYVEWIANAAIIKLRTASLNLPYTLDSSEQKRIVMEYFAITQSILEKENELSRLYADASITDKEKATEAVREELEKLYERQNKIAPLAEAILQDQISQVLAEIHLTAAGQPIPNVWYHSTPLPMAMIVSPRDHIEQTANISVDTDLTVDDQVKLEDDITQGLNVSTLIVQIGGIGVYPTMVMRTTNMPWVLNTIAHEWIHNYLTLRPLGLLYSETPELRTMNETAASIAGDEIGALVIEKFYPELKPAAFPNLNLISLSFDRPDPATLTRPPFDFRAQMHETRIHADELLAQGKIDEAEAYMEARRQVFLKNGYLLRKINQAYFAFHGAYADSPGGAAGEDPVGPAVRTLRAQSDSLADFIKTMAWMWSFEQLQEAISQ